MNDGMVAHATVVTALKKVARNNKTYFVLEDVNKVKFTVWDEKLFSLIDGLNFPAKLVITFDVEGSYRNARKIALDSNQDIPSREVFVPSLEKPYSPPFNDKKDKRISRLACINSSIAFFEMLGHYGVKEIPNASKILDTAEEFEKWVYRGAEE